MGFLRGPGGLQVAVVVKMVAFSAMFRETDIFTEMEVNK